MVFNSWTFAFFFVGVLVVLPWLRLRSANTFLLLASAVFYAAWDWRFLGLLAFSAVFNQGCGQAIHRAEGRARRHWLIVNVGVNLLILGFFKYYGFFAENLNALVSWMGWGSALPTLHIVLPLAISFYTFHCLSYTIDIYRREIAPSESLADFALYLLLFPHLVAGPIVRAATLMPQIAKERQVTPQDWKEGVFLLLWGLFKKAVVADNLGPKADRLFAMNEASAGEVFLGVLAFAFQIYADFSGYTDMARGSARLMGFHFDLNFRFPYLSGNPQEFWRRWHISLSQWLRDYVYIPLGGSRQGEARTQWNLMATMVIGGMWHGAAWNFILWGAYHGSLLSLHRWWQKRAKPHQEAGSFSLPPVLGKAWTVGVMFAFTLYGWLLFRAVSFEQIAHFTVALARPNEWFQTSVLKGVAQQGIYILPLLGMEAWMLRRGQTELVFRSPLANGLLYVVLIYAVILLGSQGGETFIYFNF